MCATKLLSIQHCAYSLHSVSVTAILPSGQTAFIALNSINFFDFVTEKHLVFCEV